MSAIDKEPFPRGALIAAGSIVAISLALTAANRIAKIHGPAAPSPAAAGQAVSAVALRFLDQPDGSVLIKDAATGERVSTVHPGEGGFIRGVMRGLARERMGRRIGSGPAFRLWLQQGGGLWLQDTATGRLIDLDSFGSSNRAAFMALLPRGGRTS
jgi:putative photosynthetic complex assembly protein